MKCPPPGLCIPVVYERCRDGDTVEVSIPGSAFIWAVRLLDCWCPGLDSELGRKAKQEAHEYMAASETCMLWVPLPKGRNLLQSLSFDRIVGVLILEGGDTLNGLLISHGLASSKKTGTLGE